MRIVRSVPAQYHGLWVGALSRAAARKGDSGAFAPESLSRSPPAERRSTPGEVYRVVAFFLLLVLVAVVLGIIGVAAKGLGYLLIIGIVVLVVDVAVAAVRLSRRARRRPLR